MVSSSDLPGKTAAPPSMLKGASLLIVLQLLSRLLTFFANQLLLRYMTAPLLGISAQFEVYYLSVLFFARESLRVAIQRQGIGTSSEQGSSEDVGTAMQDEGGKEKKRTAGNTPRNESASDEKHTQKSPIKPQTTTISTAQESQAIINLASLSIPLGLVVSLLLGYIYLAYTPHPILQRTPNLALSLRLYGLAALIELLSEPCFVLMQTRLRFGTRAAAESLATFLRCAVVLGTAVRSAKVGEDVGVLPFALGQVTYGVVLLVVYLIAGRRLASTLGFSLWPWKVAASRQRTSGGQNASGEFALSLFYRPTVRLAGSMMAQSVVKHVLTQGDSFLVMLLSTPDVQGVYALANNYGGLLARLLFQPVEESSRSYFSRLLAASSPSSTSKPTAASPAVVQAKTNLQPLLRLYTLLSTIIVTIGPLAAPPLLALVAGHQWSQSGAGAVLAAYALYIPFLALNGLTESFVASVASEADVHRQSGWMGVFSVVFAASAFLFMRVLDMGAKGLVAANAANMACRIVWSLAFIRRYFRNAGVAFEVRKLVPGTSLATATAVALALRNSNFMDDAQEDPVKILVKIGASALPLVMAM